MLKLSYIKYLVFALTIVTALISGCSDEDKELDPTISVGSATVVNNADLILKDGVAPTFTLAFTANKGKDGKDLQTLKITVAYDGGAATDLIPVQTISGATFNYSQTYPTRLVKGREVYTVLVTDKDGKSASFTRTINVKEETGPVVTKPKSFDNVTLNNVNNCLNTDNGTPYQQSNGQGVSGEIDLTYLYTDAARDNIISPQARTNRSLFGAATVDQKTIDVTISWGSVNTVLKSTSLTPDAFIALKNQDQSEIKKAFDAGSEINIGNNNPSGSRATAFSGTLSNGKVIAYSSKGKYGLILVKSLAGENNPTGSMTIDILRVN